MLPLCVFGFKMACWLEFEREREREREKDSVACQREREKRDRSKTNRDDLKLHETKKLVGGDEPENVN